jgi:hypothetical protein
MTPERPPGPDTSGNGQPKTRPRWAAPPDAKPPATPPSPEEQTRLAERRLLDEMARHRRAEQQQMQAVQWGCIGLLAAMILLMLIGFLFF